MVGIRRTITDDLPSEAVIFGASAPMQDLRVHVESTLSCHTPFLVQGESGIGKQLVARYVHQRSERGQGPFVSIGCCGMPPKVLERELFGYEKDAFQGIRSGRNGLVDAAEGGTLFISQIEDMHLNLQEKLLRLLREGSYTRVGDTVERRANVRVICSTKLELLSEVSLGRFRQDLFCCVSALCLRPSALRKRKEDIPVLWDFFAERMANKFKKSPPRLTMPVLQILEEWYWPGNLRELQNRVARSVILGEIEALVTELRYELARKDAVDPLHDTSSMARSDSSRSLRTPWGDVPLNRLGEWIIRNGPEGYRSRYRKPH